MIELAKVSVSLVPVIVFLAALILLDSYKLVRFSVVGMSIVVGGIVAVVCMFFNGWLMDTLALSSREFTRYLAPASEELLKALLVLYLIKVKRIGFLVDAAIIGFAVGAGFALVENVYYLQRVESSNILLWIIRGFGTAVMHGSATAISGFIAKDLFDRHGGKALWTFFPGLMLAYFIHSGFNHFLLPPLWQTLVLLIGFPLFASMLFVRSERATRDWLGVGLDADMEILESITGGEFRETRIGQYLKSLKGRFPGPIVADMLCLLRIHHELGLKAKGVLIMREAGVVPPTDLSLSPLFDELRFLEKSIGKTGKLAILPFLHRSSRDLWQIHMLRD